MKEILINCGIIQKSGVILANGELEDVFVEHTASSGAVGNVYKGIVDNVVPGMQSAFIDIGLEKNAFLFIDDIANKGNEADIRKLLKKGQEIVVQIIKEAQGVKGARVSTAITLPGHNLVLMPDQDYVGVSKKIEDEEAKTRLKTLISKLKDEHHGYIVRTDACSASQEQIQTEMDYLEDLWLSISRDAKIKNAPAILHSQDSLLLTVIRDFFDDSIEKLTVNTSEAFTEAKRLASVLTPNLQNRIFLKEADLFALTGIETKIKKLLQKKVWLDNGGYLVIDYTEALTVIDVNTGKFTGDYDLNKTIVKTNVLAAKEIARQLRLRAIGGIIVVDFIDMESDEDRQTVLDALEEASKSDKTKTNILGFAPLGLVELTRKKSRLSLADSMQCTCPYCEGDGRILNENSILNNLLFALKRAVDNNDSTIAVLRLNPYILTALKKHVTALKENFASISIFVREDQGMHVEDYNISLLNEISDQEGLIKVI